MAILDKTWSLTSVNAIRAFNSSLRLAISVSSEISRAYGECHVNHSPRTCTIMVYAPSTLRARNEFWSVDPYSIGLLAKMQSRYFYRDRVERSVLVLSGQQVIKQKAGTHA